MVRTRDSSGRKAVAAKAPRKALVATGRVSSASPASKSKYSGAGNRAVSRPVPEWQKGITGFLKPGTSKEDPKAAEAEAASDEETENMDPEVSAENVEQEQSTSTNDDGQGPSGSGSSSSPMKNGLISDDDDD